MSTRKRRADGEASRIHILETALRLFRERGFHETTMRDIASAAGLSLGAAYYYFPSKEALVLAYYAQIQDRHEEKAKATLENLSDLRSRLGAVMHTKLDLLEDDQRLLRAILQTTLGADEPSSVFSQETKDVRKQSIGIFLDALAREDLPDESRPLLAQALWALHLGFLLYYVNDKSPRQEKTRALVDGALDLVARIAPLVASPMLGPIRTEVARLLGDAGLAAPGGEGAESAR
jgi:AcrR family transcriptional regulator